MTSSAMRRELEIDEAAWLDLVSRSPHATVFVTRQWLTCFGDSFERRAVANKDGRYVAGFVLQRHSGVVGNVGLTPYQGLVAPVEESGSLGAAERAAVEALSRSLAAEGTVGRIRCQPGLLDLKPFVWSGAQLALSLTHQVPPMPAEQCWEHLAPQVRGHVRRGDRHGLEQMAADDVAQLRELVLATFTPWFDADAEFAGLSEAVRRGLVSVEVAVLANQVQGAIAVCHGAATDHYLLSGRRSDAVSGVVPWLLWSSLSSAVNRGRGFDFEGSMLPGVSQFYDQFRGVLTPVAELVLGDTVT